MKKFICLTLFCTCLWNFAGCGKAQTQQTEAARPATATQMPTRAATRQYIGEESAKQIAVAHARVERTQAENLRVSFEYENGQPVYEVEFRQGEREFEYKIHAGSGKVLAYESDD